MFVREVVEEHVGEVNAMSLRSAQGQHVLEGTMYQEFTHQMYNYL